ncbi:MAG TPA: cytochrome c peroxidase [Polyangia bacterium]|nr:cytochrome c peroxidase [Polyangia bacterium]
MSRRANLLLAAILGAPATPACQGGAGLPTETDTLPVLSASGAPGEPLLPVPAVPPLDARRVALGRRLFSEPRLSRDDSTSCATCHVLERGGVDGRPLSIGVGGAVGAVNTPTVFNAALNFRQFWDGRALTLEEQIDGPLQHRTEMDSSYEAVIVKLGRDPSWVRQVESAYGGGSLLTASLIRDAIATYERSLVLADSRFDRFLAGDQSSLDADERHGYELFKSYGCASCHQGANVGGNMFERLGAAHEYFDAPRTTGADLGRYNVTHRDADRHVFRVSSLRLVTLTAPYLHNGTVQSLPQMIRMMALYQLGRDLPASDVDFIEKFLGTLLGRVDGVTFATTP